MITIISHAKDPHAARVESLLKREGRDVLLLDVSDLPARGSLTIDYDRPAAPRILYRLGNGGQFDLDVGGSVWWRRPQIPDLSTITDANVHAFTHNEWQEAINGLWQLIDARWMNPPSRDEVAGRKALQLKIAAEVGLRTPRTLVTSDPDAARRFIKSRGVGQTVFKTFSCTHAIWRETRIVHEEELEMLESVRLAPVIFQEFIEAEADVRVTIVGKKIFSAAIFVRENDYPADFRMSLGNARTEAVELPSDIAARLRAMMDRMGLVYGAIDLRRTRAGEHVFLEINTAGEFLFVEERTGQPIAQAIADWLVKPP